MNETRLDKKERLALLRGIFIFQIIILFFQVMVLILLRREWMT